MKWFYRTAQVFTPGLVHDKVLALKGRPNWCRFVTERSVSKAGRPFRSNLLGAPYPGLKTWAVLFCHFMARELSDLIPH